MCWTQLRQRVGELAPESAVVGRAGHSLSARWVVHCVAPDALARTADEHEAYVLDPASYDRGLCRRLEATYSAAISAATEAGASSLAVPALGCGIRGFARDQAASAAFRAAAAWLQSDSTTRLHRLDFVILADDVWDEWPRIAHAQLGPPDVASRSREREGGKGNAHVESVCNMSGYMFFVCRGALRPALSLTLSLCAARPHTLCTR